MCHKKGKCQLTGGLSNEEDTSEANFENTNTDNTKNLENTSTMDTMKAFGPQNTS